jgi:hypothetical protein
MLDLTGRHIKTSVLSEPEEGVHFELGATTWMTHDRINKTPSKEGTI